VVLDDTSAVDSLRRSFGLSGGYWWRTFGTYILITFIINVIGFLLGQSGNIVEILLRLIPGIPPSVVGAVGAAIFTAVSLLLNPITWIVTTLMYYDLRIRKEGFDVILLASSLMGSPVERSLTTDQIPIG
jgi:hypothetical protein